MKTTTKMVRLVSGGGGGGGGGGSNRQQYGDDGNGHMRGKMQTFTQKLRRGSSPPLGSSSPPSHQQQYQHQHQLHLRGAVAATTTPQPPQAQAPAQPGNLQTSMNSYTFDLSGFPTSGGEGCSDDECSPAAPRGSGAESRNVEQEQQQQLQSTLKTTMLTALLSLEIDVAQLDAALFRTFDEMRTFHNAFVALTINVPAGTALDPAVVRAHKARLLRQLSTLAAFAADVRAAGETVGVAAMQLGEMLADGTTASGVHGAEIVGTKELSSQVRRLERELRAIGQAVERLGAWGDDVYFGWHFEEIVGLPPGHDALPETVGPQRQASCRLARRDTAPSGLRRMDSTASRTSVYSCATAGRGRGRQSVIFSDAASDEEIEEEDEDMTTSEEDEETGDGKIRAMIMALTLGEDSEGAGGSDALPPPPPPPPLNIRRGRKGDDLGPLTITPPVSPGFQYGTPPNQGISMNHALPPTPTTPTPAGITYKSSIRRKPTPSTPPPPQMTLPPLPPPGTPPPAPPPHRSPPPPQHSESPNSSTSSITPQSQSRFSASSFTLPPALQLAEDEQLARRLQEEYDQEYASKEERSLYNTTTTSSNIYTPELPPANTPTTISSFPVIPEHPPQSPASADGIEILQCPPRGGIYRKSRNIGNRRLSSFTTSSSHTSNSDGLLSPSTPPPLPPLTPSQSTSSYTNTLSSSPSLASPTTTSTGWFSPSTPTISENESTNFGFPQAAAPAAAAGIQLIHPPAPPAPPTPQSTKRSSTMNIRRTLTFGGSTSVVSKPTVDVTNAVATSTPAGGFTAYGAAYGQTHGQVQQPFPQHAQQSQGHGNAQTYQQNYPPPQQYHQPQPAAPSAEQHPSGGGGGGIRSSVWSLGRRARRAVSGSASSGNNGPRVFSV
ncbi:hypothetical protein DFH27DRAFT_613038 [Peziza echinospora]|nr:hypothetical protein DFH27DRAFT_613038 [Peziza echinospora]